jgi:hypothetical protein
MSARGERDQGTNKAVAAPRDHPPPPAARALNMTMSMQHMPHTHALPARFCSRAQRNGQSQVFPANDGPARGLNLGLHTPPTPAVEAWVAVPRGPPAERTGDLGAHWLCTIARDGATRSGGGGGVSNCVHGCWLGCLWEERGVTVVPRNRCLGGRAAAPVSNTNLTTPSSTTISQATHGW